MSPAAGVQGIAMAGNAEPEDLARAGHYALLARLYYAPPDAALLDSVLAAAREFDAAQGDSGSLAAAWHELGAAAAAESVDAIADEYDNVFIGVGKAEVTLYGSHYMHDKSPGQVLVRLRDELQGLGLVRSAGAGEPEDHIAALCDTMRHLVLSADSGDRQQDHGVAALQQQRHFFMEYISPWYAEFCISVAASGKTKFYKPVAALSKAFFDVEAEAFDLT
jgi:TorA maturation chaperone TorD